MRACRAGLAALWAVSLLCWAASGAQGRQIAEPEPAGAAALDAPLFGTAGGDAEDHAAQPRLFKQELPVEAREGATEQKEGEGEDKTIAQVRWWGPQSVQHRAWSAMGRAMGLQLPGATATGAARTPRCLFESMGTLPWPGHLPQMLDEKLKEEFKKEEEQKEGAGKQFNETVASSEVGGGEEGGPGAASQKQVASLWHPAMCGCGCTAAALLPVCGMTFDPSRCCACPLALCSMPPTPQLPSHRLNRRVAHTCRAPKKLWSSSAAAKRRAPTPHPLQQQRQQQEGTQPLAAHTLTPRTALQRQQVPEPQAGQQAAAGAAMVMQQLRMPPMKPPRWQLRRRPRSRLSMTSRRSWRSR